MDHEQNDEIRRQSSERFSIYRRCKVEDIELPLESGSLKNVPLEEVSAVDILICLLELRLRPLQTVVGTGLVVELVVISTSAQVVW